MRIIAITTITIMEIANTDNKNNIDERCKKCFKKLYQRLFEKFQVDENQRMIFDAFYKEAMISMHSLSSPEIQRELNQRFCEITGIIDPFESEKRIFNDLAMKLTEEWKPKVLVSKNPFDMALRLAIAGNIIDYGANHQFDVYETIEKVMTESFAINHSEQLKKGILKAENVLYLGDNAGEIAFDKLFIETMQAKNVTFAVKGGPILNDTLEKDAQDVKMHEVASVISNGYDAPSTVLSKSSRDFNKIFKSADIIISKGQGNLEGLLLLNDPRIYFLLMVKCEMIADLIQVQKDDFVVVNRTIKT